MIELANCCQTDDEAEGGGSRGLSSELIDAARFARLGRTNVYTERRPVIGAELGGLKALIECTVQKSDGIIGICRIISAFVLEVGQDSQLFYFLLQTSYLILESAESEVVGGNVSLDFGLSVRVAWLEIRTARSLIRIRQSCTWFKPESAVLRRLMSS